MTQAGYGHVSDALHLPPAAQEASGPRVRPYPLRPLAHRLVHVQHPCRDRRPVVAAHRRRRPARRSPPAAPGRPAGPTSGRGQRGRVAGREQDAERAVVQHAPERAEVARRRRARPRSSPPPARSRSSRRRCAARRTRPPTRSSDALDASSSGPSSSIAPAAAGDRSSSASSPSPRPSTRNRAPGCRSSTAGTAAASSGRPLRGSSSRPTNATVGRSGVPLHSGAGRRRGETVDVHAVRDDDGVAAEVLDDGPPRVLRHGDPRAHLLQPGPQHRVRRLHHPRAQVRGVERRDDRPLGRPQRQQRERRRRRLVDVQDVELALGQPAAHPRRAHRPEVHAARRSRCTSPGRRGRPARRTAAPGCRRPPGPAR